MLKNKKLPKPGEHFTVDGQEFVVLSDSATHHGFNSYVYAEPEGLRVHTASRRWMLQNAEPINGLHREIARMAAVLGITVVAWVICAALAGAL